MPNQFLSKFIDTNQIIKHHNVLMESSRGRSIESYLKKKNYRRSCCTMWGYERLLTRSLSKMTETKRIPRRNRQVVVISRKIHLRFPRRYTRMQQRAGNNIRATRIQERVDYFLVLYRNDAAIYLSASNVIAYSADMRYLVVHGSDYCCSRVIAKELCSKERRFILKRMNSWDSSNNVFLAFNDNDKNQKQERQRTSEIPFKKNNFLWKKKTLKMYFGASL